MNSSRLKTICVVGLGYIGLPTAVVLASRGLSVIGVDTNADVVSGINRGEIHIVEPDLDALTSSVVKTGNLRAATQPEVADAFIIAVPTPFHDGQPDMSFVTSAITSIAPVLKRGDLVILESTSPPGTTEDASRQLAKLRPDLRFPREEEDQSDVYLAYCPERVLPGKILTELLENDRVIGGITALCSEKAADLYSIFCNGSLLRTKVRLAELCKLTENSFRDVNIAFANELSIVCDKLDINVWELVRLANHHPRVNILQPGPGVGGHCIAVDPWFIVSAAPEEARLIRTAREINDGKPAAVLAKIKEALASIPSRRPKIALLGLTFKPDVDDLRESPALQIAEAVASWNNCDVLVSEPHIKKLPNSLGVHPYVKLTDIDSAVEHADVAVMLVNHRAYNAVARKQLERKLIIDTRGVWS